MENQKSSYQLPEPIKLVVTDVSGETHSFSGQLRFERLHDWLEVYSLQYMIDLANPEQPARVASKKLIAAFNSPRLFKTVV